MLPYYHSCRQAAAVAATDTVFAALPTQPRGCTLPRVAQCSKLSVITGSTRWRSASRLISGRRIQKSIDGQRAGADFKFAKLTNELPSIPRRRWKPSQNNGQNIAIITRARINVGSEVAIKADKRKRISVLLFFFPAAARPLTNPRGINPRMEYNAKSGVTGVRRIKRAALHP